MSHRCRPWREPQSSWIGWLLLALAIAIVVAACFDPQSLLPALVPPI
jgi:hypothetical protein